MLCPFRKFFAASQALFPRVVANGALDRLTYLLEEAVRCYFLLANASTALLNSGVTQQMLWLRFSSSIAASRDGAVRF